MNVIIDAIRFCQNGDFTPFPKEDLIAIQTCYDHLKSSLSGLTYINRHTVTPPLARSLIADKDRCYVLMTQTIDGDKELGRGSYKGIKFAVDIIHNEICAVGICKLPKRNLGRRTISPETQWERIVEQTAIEVFYMRSSKEGSPHLIGHHGSVKASHPEKGNKYFIMMDYCNGGDIEQALSSDDQQLRFVIQNPTFLSRIVEGVQSLHNQDGVHTDIRLENIFLRTLDDGALIPVIGDTGQAVKSNSKGPFPGNEQLWSPEMAKAFLDIDSDSHPEYVYDSSFDVWTLGLSFFSILHPEHHQFAFQEGPSPEITAELKNETLGLEIDESRIDSKYHRLLKGMLEVDPEQRWNLVRIREELLEIETSQDLSSERRDTVGDLAALVDNAKIKPAHHGSSG